MQGNSPNLEQAVQSRKVKALKRLQLGNCSGLIFPQEESLSTYDRVVDRIKKIFYTQDEYIDILLNLNGS